MSIRVLPVFTRFMSRLMFGTRRMVIVSLTSLRGELIRMFWVSVSACGSGEVGWWHGCSPLSMVGMVGAVCFDC